MEATTTKRRPTRRSKDGWVRDITLVTPTVTKSMEDAWKANIRVNSQKPAVSKTMQFARQNKGAIVVKDPTFLLF